MSRAGCAVGPISYSSRVVMAAWWIFCIVVVSTYAANLIAFLSVTKFSLPFDTREEMVAQGKFKFGTLGSTGWVDDLKVIARRRYWCISN